MVIGIKQEDIDTIHENGMLSKMKKILNNKTHPFYPIYVQQQIECSGKIELEEFAQIDTQGPFSHYLSNFITKILTE